jgi:hypothetical protein
VLWVTLHIAISSHFCQTNEYDLKKPDTFVTSSNLSWPHQSNWFPQCYSTKMLCFYVCRSSCSVGVPICLIFQIYLVYSINEHNPNMKLRANVNFSTTFLSPRLYEKGTMHLLVSIANVVKYFFLYVYCMSNRFQLFLLPSFKKYCVIILEFLFSNFTLKFC